MNGIWIILGLLFLLMFVSMFVGRSRGMGCGMGGHRHDQHQSPAEGEKGKEEQSERHHSGCC